MISGGITGAGAAKRFSAVRWGVAGNIVVAWLLTLPAAAAAGAAVYGITTLFGHGATGPIVISAVLLAVLGARAGPPPGAGRPGPGGLVSALAGIDGGALVKLLYTSAARRGVGGGRVLAGDLRRHPGRRHAPRGPRRPGRRLRGARHGGARAQRSRSRWSGWCSSPTRADARSAGARVRAGRGRARREPIPAAASRAMMPIASSAWRTVPALAPAPAPGVPAPAGSGWPAAAASRGIAARPRRRPVRRCRARSPARPAVRRLSALPGPGQAEAVRHHHEHRSGDRPGELGGEKARVRLRAAEQRRDDAEVGGGADQRHPDRVAAGGGGGGERVQAALQRARDRAVGQEHRLAEQHVAGRDRRRRARRPAGCRQPAPAAPLRARRRASLLARSFALAPAAQRVASHVSEHRQRRRGERQLHVPVAEVGAEDHGPGAERRKRAVVVTASSVISTALPTHHWQMAWIENSSR